MESRRADCTRAIGPLLWQTVAALRRLLRHPGVKLGPGAVTSKDDIPMESPFNRLLLSSVVVLITWFARYRTRWTLG